MNTQEALQRASAALTDLAKSAESSEQRAVKAEQRVRELTNEIKRLKESEEAEKTKLKEIFRSKKLRVEELAEENQLLKRSADAAHFAGRELKNRVGEQEKQIEELIQKASEWEEKYHTAVDHSSEQEKELKHITEEYEELDDLYKMLEDKLAEVSPKEALAEHERRTQEQEQDPGTPPVREETATVDSSTNTDNPLEPFRFGGCRCRVWKDGQGTQCSHAGRVNGVCGHHHSLIEEAGRGAWQFGFYDEPRPDIWGTDHEGKCLPIPTGRKEGNEILWSMPQKEWARAFSSQYQCKE